MKKVIVILVILALAFGVWYIDKIQKEKAVFGGKTKGSITRKLRALWKPEFERTQAIWIESEYDTDSVFTTAYDEKMEETGKSLAEQILADVNYLWENEPENRHPYDYGGWRTTWIISKTEDEGIDSNMSEVIDMISKV